MARPNAMTRTEVFRKAIEDQVAWINDHGGNRDGYVKRYGAAGTANCYGDGGEAIFEADKAKLTALVDDYARHSKRMEKNRA